MKTNLARFLLLLAGWGILAAVAGAGHLLAWLPAAGPQFIIGLLTLGFSVTVLSVGWVREAVAQIPLQPLLIAHVWRAVPGIWFVWLGTQGRLPLEFAHRAGWGDIAAALGAAVLLVWSPGPSFRPWLKAWNLFGLADLFVAVGTAGWLNFAQPGSMVEISGFPLALVPLFFVPVLAASHLVIFRRLRTDRTDIPRGWGEIQARTTR